MNTDAPVLLDVGDSRHDERTVIAGALHGGADVARELLRTVEAWMFHDLRLGRTWAALDAVLYAGDPGSLLDPVADELVRMGEDEATTRHDLAELSHEVPSAANATYYARRVVEGHVHRQAASMLSEDDLKRNAYQQTDDILAGVEARCRRLRELLTGAADAPVVRDVADFVSEPQPAPLLWRDPASSEPNDREPDAVLSVGECAILASEGGLGKSTLSLEVASAAAIAATQSDNYGAACGLCVAAGPVVLVSYEDSPPRIAHRLTWITDKVPTGKLFVVSDPTPLWLAAADRGGESRPGAQWEPVWRAVRDVGARLVVIDPVSAALADVDTSQTGPVRAFLRELTREAEAAGAGVLLVAHSTKAARDAVAKGEDPGAGIVAGSAAWYDGARGVLALARDPRSDDRLLECVKANYGRTGWGARLRERTDPDGAFRGLKLGARLNRADLDVAKRPLTRQEREAAAKATANGAGKVPVEDLESV